MVQREVADRFFAAPGTKAYGAVSVLIQLAAEKTGFHPVARTVFRPRPRVDSALVAVPAHRASGGLRTVEAHRDRRVRAPAEDVAQLTRAGRAGEPRRNDPRARRSGPSRVDAGGGSHSRRARLAGSSTRVKTIAAPGKINLALVVGPRRSDGKHEVVTVMQRVDLSDQISLAPARGLEVEGFPEDTLVRRALHLLAEAANAEPGWAVRIDKRIPVAAGLGGGSSDAASALRLANETLAQPLSDELCMRWRLRWVRMCRSSFRLDHSLARGTAQTSRRSSCPRISGSCSACRPMRTSRPRGPSTRSSTRATARRASASGRALLRFLPGRSPEAHRPRAPARQRPGIVATGPRAARARSVSRRRKRRRTDGLRPLRGRADCARGGALRA